ncbi:MAG: ATP-binding cassette domain-containing protein, partial [Desulfobacterales bacterium]
MPDRTPLFPADRPPPAFERESNPGRRPPPMLTLERVTARIRDRRILPDTSWTIRAGQSWAVLGPNGAGKSTLAGLLLGKVPYVTGRLIRHTPAALPQRIGHVSFELLEKMAAREIRRQEARQFSGRLDSVTTVRDLLLDETATAAAQGPPPDRDAKRLGLARLLDRDFSGLSSGELRRVLIARALLKRPEMLVFDEPFEGLDADSQGWLKESISEMIRQGKTVVLVTHRIQNLVAGISHALFVRDGRVVQKGHRTRVLTKSRIKRLFASPDPHSLPPRPQLSARPPKPAGPGAEPLV